MGVMPGDHAHGGGLDDSHAHDHGEHPAILQHHFETLGQQFESDKLGIWLFLATEVLLFAGLFCAYSVYRANHPEVFEYAHHFLNKTLGGINTVVLLLSSLTMAWAVRCAQLGQRKLQIGLLIVTLMCACGFLGIKYIEYTNKWREHLLPGAHYTHKAEEDRGVPGMPQVAETVPPVDSATAIASAAQAPEDHALSYALPAGSATIGSGKLLLDASKISAAHAPPAGLVPATTGDKEDEFGAVPKNVQTFFAVYFVMTGLHGVHVVAGMIAIFMVLIYTIQGKYSPQWYNPVDMVALYWHIVDLVWIFLFPLLYLIH